MTAAPTAFSTLREGSLHAALKARYLGTDAIAEGAIDGFVVDVVCPDRLVEIQTASVASIRAKLERLVGAHPVLLVYPVALERWLIRVGEGGELLGRRRSPKRGLPVDAFDELVSVATLIGGPNFDVDLVLIREEEVRGPIPPGARYRYPRTWWRLDRRLIDVVDTWRIASAPDLLRLLPSGLPDPFTSADVVAVTRRSRRLATRVVYTLEKAGAAQRVGRRGRHIAYRLSAP